MFVLQNSWKKGLEEVFDSRVSIRKEMTVLDGSEKILSLKILKKESTLNRLKMFVTDTSGQQQVQTTNKYSTRDEGPQ